MHGAQTSPNPLFKGSWNRPSSVWCKADVTKPFVQRGLGASQHCMVQRRRHQTLCSKGVGIVPAPHETTQTSPTPLFKGDGIVPAPHGATQASPNPLFKGGWARSRTAWCNADVTNPFVQRGLGASQHRMVSRRRRQTLCSKGVGSVPAPHGAMQASPNPLFKGGWDRFRTAWCNADVTKPFVQRGLGVSRHRMV